MSDAMRVPGSAVSHVERRKVHCSTLNEEHRASAETEQPSSGPVTSNTAHRSRAGQSARRFSVNAPTIGDLCPLLFERCHPFIDARKSGPAPFRVARAQMNASRLEHVPNLLIGKLQQEIREQLSACLTNHGLLERARPRP
jgi:hypothetical protein